VVPVSKASELEERNLPGEPTKQSGDERRARPGGHAVKRSVVRSRSVAEVSNDDRTIANRVIRAAVFESTHKAMLPGIAVKR
jgi:hypothetical protein